MCSKTFDNRINALSLNNFIINKEDDSYYKPGINIQINQYVMALLRTKFENNKRKVPINFMFKTAFCLKWMLNFCNFEIFPTRFNRTLKNIDSKYKELSKLKD